MNRKPVQNFLLDICKQLGVITVVAVMAFVFMAATEEIGAQTTFEEELPDLSQPLDTETTTVNQTPTLQDFTKPRSNVVAENQLELDLAEVQRSYRGQLEEYRTLQQQFVVAKEEYLQLQTLSALEAAVQSTQKVFVMRDRVMLSYLKSLELRTRLATALDDELKEESLYVLEETQKAVTRHLEDTQASSDRAAIQERTTEFESIAELYSFTTAFSKQVLQLGSLRANYQQAVDIFEDLPLEVAGQTALQKAARGRALEQIAINLDDVDDILNEFRIEVAESLQDIRVSNTTAPEEAFAVLQRIVGFLDEVHVPTNK